MKWYSQLGQDKWVMETLAYKRDGYFVDVGAADGVALSNTFALEETFGWKGIAIEANDFYIDSLFDNRRCTVVHALVMGSVRDVEFQEAGFLSGAVEGFNEPTKQRMRIEGVADGPITVVRSQTLAAILDANGAPPVIDFLSIDTEGSEPDILAAFPFDRYCFRTICVEHNNFAEPMRKLRAILIGAGYKLETTVGGQDDYWIGRC